MISSVQFLQDYCFSSILHSEHLPCLSLNSDDSCLYIQIILTSLLQGKLQVFVEMLCIFFVMMNVYYVRFEVLLAMNGSRFRD